QVLRSDHVPAWSLAELEAELVDVAPRSVALAVAQLAQHGVLEREGDSVRASRAARRLDALGLISI
ncbi:MAG: hypothetical protein ACLP0L_14770, partial [Solirubrobacteraceae bacterium]